MPRPKAIRAPTTTSLPNSLRLPSTTPSLVKSFGKLSRQALLDLVFQWLDHRSVQAFLPYLDQDNAGPRDDDETSPYAPAKTVDEVRDVYYDLQDRKGAKREVIDRILEGDWRHGITLRQLAMVDIRYMDDHPSSLRWTAMELVPISIQDNNIREHSTENSSAIPRVHTATFLNNLQQQISPLVKAHYHLVRSNSLPLTFLRILVTDSPYQNLRDLPGMLTDSSRVIYVVFPDSCPFIYTSISSTKPKASATTTSAVATDSRSLQRLVRESIPAALSRAQEKYTLKPTSLTAKSLQALLALRGPGRSNAASGAFSIFADAAVEGSPLDPRPADTVSPEEYMGRQRDRAPGDEDDAKNNESLSTSMKKPNDGDTNSPASKRRKVAVNSRFGTSGSLSSAPLDRLDIRMLDRLDQDEEDGSIELSQPSVSLTFSGADVVSGIRKLSELGVVDPLRMPSWMTGEEGVSVAVVHRGKRVVKDGG
ncbi:hypothetical protein PHISP_02715 [Aspergillus sp. HF37]|nr:hypothetical protein PHISP_02715 [Aspergillus sp. HF37]